MLKKFNLIFLIIFSSCAFLPSKKNILIKANIYPGQVSKIDLGQLSSSFPKKVNCLMKNLDVSNSLEGKYILWAESYFSAEKKYFCTFSGNEELISLDLTVVPKEYPKETLKVDRKRVDLNKSDLNRVIREREILKQVYQSGSTKPLFMKKFKYPLSSKVTSEYGVSRLFNGIRKSQHLGIDFRARVGRKIPVSNSGIVVLASDLFFTGNTIIVDHGMNIFTLYGHLSEIFVGEGDTVNKGDILGLAGKTGRVTGPHLHWGVKVQGNWVDGSSIVTLNIP